MNFKTFCLMPIIAYSSAHAFDVKDCLSIQKDLLRLACFDSKLNRKPSDATGLQLSEDQSKPKPMISLLLRESGEFDNFAGAEISKKAGKLFLQRNDGQTSTVIKSAVLATFRPINDLGWQPFASISLDKDTTEKSPKDLRGLHVGITGPLWDAYKNGGTLYTTLRVTQYKNISESEKSSNLVLHTNVIKNSWVNSPVNATYNSYNIIPNFGFITENSTNSLVSGRRTSGYIGIDASYDLTGLLPKLSISGSYRRFADLSNSIDTQKRNVNHSQISLNYALTDPKNEKLAFRPYLIFSHEVGTDILGGSTSPKKMSSIGVKFTYN